MPLTTALTTALTKALTTGLTTGLTPAPVPPKAPRRAEVAGHFGELLQGRLGPAGEVALITLPCPVLRLRATWRPGPGLRLHVPARLIGLRQLRRFLTLLGVAPRGAFALRADMAPGAGAGASTAALVAVARLVAPGLAPEVLARAALAVEGASDPLMFPAPERLLWASRAARAVEGFAALPRFEVLGGTVGPGQRTDPRDSRFADISDLVPAWRAAAARGDLPALAGLATASARRNQALRGPREDPTAALAASLGALGHVAAHTGAARGLIFAPGQVPDGAARALRAAGFRGLVRFRAGGPAR